MNLVLARQAFSVIEEECLSHPHVESGGILVGARTLPSAQSGPANNRLSAGLLFTCALNFSNCMTFSIRRSRNAQVA